MKIGTPWSLFGGSVAMCLRVDTVVRVNLARDTL